jgi:hypothetical protein
MKYFGCDGSGELSASQSITTLPGFLTSLLVFTDGVNDGQVILYDSKNGATGKVLAKIPVPGELNYGGRNWSESAFRDYKDGIYAALSGSNASYIVEHIKKAE